MINNQEKPSFRKELQHIINCYSKENGSDTPDFILAEYLCACLHAFDNAVTARSAWYSKPGIQEEPIVDEPKVPEIL